MKKIETKTSYHLNSKEKPDLIKYLEGQDFSLVDPPIWLSGKDVIDTRDGVTYGFFTRPTLKVTKMGLRVGLIVDGNTRLEQVVDEYMAHQPKEVAEAQSVTQGK